MDQKQRTHEQDGSVNRDIRRDTVIGALLGGAIGFLIEGNVLGLLLGILLGAVIGYRLESLTPQMKYPPHLLRRMILAAGIYFLVLIGSYTLISDSLDAPLKITLGLAPIAPGFYLFYAIGSAIAHLDELQRRIQLEAIAISFGGTLLTTMSVGMLDTIGVVQLNWIYITLMMSVFWLAGKLWTMWKYR